MGRPFSSYISQTRPTLWDQWLGTHTYTQPVVCELFPDCECTAPTLATNPVPYLWGVEAQHLGLSFGGYYQPLKPFINKTSDVCLIGHRPLSSICPTTNRHMLLSNTNLYLDSWSIYNNYAFLSQITWWN